MKHLTYEQTFRSAGPRLLGPLPRIQGWLDDEHYLELRSNGETSRVGKLLKVNARTGAESVHLDYKELSKVLPKGVRIERAVARTRSYKRLIIDHDNDLYYLDADAGSFRRLTSTPSAEKNARFSPDGTHIAYTRDHDLYVYDLEEQLERQLTSDGSKTLYNGFASWVYYEEILGRRTNYAAFWWSPTSDRIAFLQFDDSPVPEFPIFHADGAHGEMELQRYPKAGDPNPWVRLGVVHLATGEVVWVDVEEKADHYVAWPFWTPDGKSLYFQWMNRGQDNIKIYAADPMTGEKREVYDEKQASWVEFFTDLYFLKKGRGFLLRSDKDGWAHLYHYDLDGKLKHRLTRGDWRVASIALVDEESGRVYFEHTLGDATELHLSSVDLQGRDLKRHTTVAGTHSCRLSPKGTYFIDRYSNIHQPTKIDLVKTSGGLVRTLGNQYQEALAEYALGKVELFTIKTKDGFELPAVWTLPPDFHEDKKYPIIFQIYSGPGATTVTNAYRRLTSQYFAQKGIITISVDHRGSNHFGKKGRALMHRNLGKWEMNDLTEAVRWLHKKPFIDRRRVGITGGSYGGYTTCMALTYGAEYFTHGVATASVTDWRLYDTVYTERYMDTPAENEKGYEFGSVMTHAEKYTGALLLVHGTIDDNVHMQNTTQLIDKLTDLDKDFDFIFYPDQRHGIRPPKRHHLNREATQFWLRHFLGEDVESSAATETDGG